MHHRDALKLRRTLIVAYVGIGAALGRWPDAGVDVDHDEASIGMAFEPTPPSLLRLLGLVAPKW
jgi:hypothetical protein